MIAIGILTVILTAAAAATAIIIIIGRVRNKAERCYIIGIRSECY